MKRRLSLDAMLAEAEARVPRIDAPGAAAIQAAGGLILDIREAAELEAGMIAGALHVPRGMLEFCAEPGCDFHLPALRPDRAIVVYCGLGARSALAGLTLLRMGYGSVHNLPCFDDWVRAGLPLQAARPYPAEE